MAQRRMFSPKIVGSDAFLEMPTSTRELYFQFGMYADDDGFISPRKIMRMIGASDDDLKMLIAKRFVLPFENGVIVIKHWRVNNLIRKDFYQETQYLEQRQTIFLKENGAYTDDSSQGVPLLDTPRQQIVNNPLPQDRLGKDRLGKDKDIVLSLFEFWNHQGTINHKKLTAKMETKIRSALKDYSSEDIKKAISNYSTVLKDDKYFWTYKWTLDEFMARGLTKFLETPIDNFLKAVKEKKPYYRGDPMIESKGKKWVVQNGAWLEFAGDKKEIEWR